jgi:hypothetical protein
MKHAFQVYKQPPGAVNDIGGVIEPGWYFVQERETASGTPAPIGPCVGPYATKRDAVRALNGAESDARRQWLAYYDSQRDRIPARIPRRPDLAYRDSGWRGWCDWLNREWLR